MAPALPPTPVPPARPARRCTVAHCAFSPQAAALMSAGEGSTMLGVGARGGAMLCTSEGGVARGVLPAKGQKQGQTGKGRRRLAAAAAGAGAGGAATVAAAAAAAGPAGTAGGAALLTGRDGPVAAA
jgi:hypothetical protein